MQPTARKRAARRRDAAHRCAGRPAARKAAFLLLAALLSFLMIPASALAADSTPGGDSENALEQAVAPDGGSDSPSEDEAPASGDAGCAVEGDVAEDVGSNAVADGTNSQPNAVAGVAGSEPAGGAGQEGYAAGAGTGAGTDSAANESDAETAGGSAPRPSGPRKVVRPVQPTHTYVFYDGVDVVETVILKEGDTVSAADGPAHPGRRFDGWFADEACSQPFAFGGEAPGDDGTTHLYAGFTDVHYFTYHDEHGKVIETEVVELGERYTFHAQWPAFTLDSDTARNDGWEDQHGNRYADLDVYPEGQDITVTGDLDLKPVVQEGFYVHFHSQGGSATVSQFVHENGKVTRPADAPTREGYTFAGWYDAAEDGNEFDFDKVYTPVPTAPVEVYAHWTPADTTYSVTIMLQDADDPDLYTFSSSLLKRGTTGQQASIEEEDYKGSLNVGGTPAYYLKRTAPSEMPLLAADGSTHIVVYLDRYYYTMDFTKYNLGSYTVRWGQSLKNVFSEELQTKLNSYTEYKLEYNGRWVQNYKWAGSSTASVANGIAPLFNSAGTGAAGAFALPRGATLVSTEENHIGTANEFRVYTYLESLQSSDSERVYDEPEIFVFRHSITDAASPPPVREGFTVYKTTKGDDSPAYGSTYYSKVTENGETFRKTNRYYSRNRYNLSFDTDGGPAVEGATDVFYGAPLEKYEPAGYKPNVTTKVEDGVGYVFEGWHRGPGLTAEGLFSFDGATMPAADLTLYAKWIPETHDVVYDPAGGAMQDIDERLTVPYGTRLEEPADPVRHGYRFVDWHLVDPGDPDGAGTPFVFGSPVTSDMVLRAHWTSDRSHTIVYRAGEGSGSVPSIGSYRSGSTGKAQAGDALTPPAGKRFAYWVAADGARYYPGDLVPVGDADVVLTAHYSPSVLVGLSYDLNYSRFGIASPVADQVVAGPRDLPVNSTVGLRQPAAAEVPAGWEFAGWYLDAACTGDALSEVMVDAHDPLPNVVYAKWVKAASPAPGVVVSPEKRADPHTAGSNPPDAAPKTGDALPVTALSVLAALSLAVAVALRPRARSPKGRHSR